MTDADIFLEESPNKKKDQTALKEACLRLLSSAKHYAEMAEAGHGNPAFHAGLACAYFVAFQKIARAIGVDADYPFVRDLAKRAKGFLKYALSPTNEKKVTIQHLKDPGGVENEKKKIELIIERDSNGNEPPDPSMPNYKWTVINQIVSALESLGYQKKDAHARAVRVYGKDKTVEQMIGEACRTQ